MNYSTYKFQKFVGKIFYKIIDAIFYIPRYLYENNEKFHKWIEDIDNKSYTKRTNKFLASNIFRHLDKQQECVVFSGFDDDNYFGFDYRDYRFETLLSDEKWIKKNKLKVEKMTLIEYVEKYIPKRKHYIRDWEKDKSVYIITR